MSYAVKEVFLTLQDGGWQAGRAGRLTKVSVHRDSCNESCSHYGPQPEA